MNLKRELKCEVDLHNSKLLFPHLPYSDNFLRTLTTILMFVRWFGIAGRTSKIAILWGLCIFVSLFLVSGLALYRVTKAVMGYAVDTTGNRSVTARLSGAIFYCNAACSLTLTWMFSASWPKLSANWAASERLTRFLPHPDLTIRRRLFLATVICFTCGLVEHILSMISAVGFDVQLTDLLKTYILSSHGFLMFKSEYSLFAGIFLFILSKFATILWNIQDLLIILISMGLSARYQRLNRQVEYLTKLDDDITDCKLAKKIPFVSWKKAREGYVRQAALVRRVDNTIGGIILLSNFNNMYFICLQLFLGIAEGLHGNAINTIYYVVSLIWLVVRATSVVLAAAEVNIQSKGALPYIYEFPTSRYNVEVERLHKQLSKDFVALSGRGFYCLERNLLLKVAGVLATYELVLIQYDGHH